MVHKAPNWIFYKRQAGPWIDGNITRLFNTGDSSPPASLSRLFDSDSDTATSAVIYGREGIANCVDASQAAQRGSGTLGLEFFFEEFSGSRAEEYWRLLDLASLAKRAASAERKKTLGLPNDNFLDEAPSHPFRILTAIERYGGGMPGALDDPDSVLARALMNVGEAQSRSGAAGSYGYGKAAVAQASRSRVIIVYTCFPPEKSSGVTRRLTGVTYWGGHAHLGERYTGWAVLGTPGGKGTSVLEDDEADAMASRLDLPVREPGVDADLGTTFMILDPAFTASDLSTAVKLFWWPLLQKTRAVRLELSISDFTGDSDEEVLDTSVSGSDPDLGDFVNAFIAAERSRSDRTSLTSEAGSIVYGEAGVTSLLVKQPDSAIEGSLVAKMRSPLMVVNYERPRNANPHVVGVFVAHDSTNENLRRVEPPEHDKWLRKRVGGLNPSRDDLRISKLVVEEIGVAVESLRKPTPVGPTDLSEFSELFPSIHGPVAKPRPKKPRGARKQRLIHVNLVHRDNPLTQVERPQLEPLGDGRLVAKATVHFWLDSDRANVVRKTSITTTISLGARFSEDGPTGEAHVVSARQVRLSHGAGDQPTFSPMGRSSHSGLYEFEGTFSLDEAHAYFEIQTDPYDSDWTIELIFDCSPWDIMAPLTKQAQAI